MRSLFQITSRTGLIACLSIGLLGIFSPPKAFAEVGIDLKLGGGKPPELDIHGENHGLFENVGPQNQGPQINSTGNYDRCFIHTNCQAGVGYSNDENNSMGAGWYCKDGKLITNNTRLDNCNIQKGCTSDYYYVDYLSNGEGWTCLEKAYIHTGCSSNPGFSNSGTRGAGWYCSDNQKVDQNTQLDPAFIKAGCAQRGSGVKYSNGIWECQS